MSSRTELPWDLITTEILQAIDACNEQRKFVNTANVARHIANNQGQYPTTLLHVKNMTLHRAVRGRVSVVLAKAGWSVFSGNGCNGNGKVFADPRY